MASSLSESGSPSGPQGPSPQPVALPQFESLDLKTRYHSDRCGGDFFDAVATDSRVVFLLTDIAGKRPETHAIAADVQKTFRTRARELFEQSDTNESESIATLARDINRSLIEAAGGVRFAPAFLGCYNLSLNILTYHYAGDLVAVFHDGEETRVLQPDGIPMGLFTHSTYEPVVLAFAHHAKLLLVTKGVTENRRGPTMLDVESIPALLENSAADSASICEAVLRMVDDSENQPKSRVLDFLHSLSQKQCDDLTVVALVRRGDS
jgi:serine phosphatase RsbU (regulator of sigma subunit)